MQMKSKLSQKRVSVRHGAWDLVIGGSSPGCCPGKKLCFALVSCKLLGKVPFSGWVEKGRMFPCQHCET